jgi:hypothetical protein
MVSPEPKYALPSDISYQGHGIIATGLKPINQRLPAIIIDKKGND